MLSEANPGGALHRSGHLGTNTRIDGDHCLGSVGVEVRGRGDTVPDIAVRRSPTGDTPDPSAPDRLVVASARDTDAYEGTVTGVHIEAIRAGQGAGPNTVLAVRGDRFVATAADIGFPIHTRTVIEPDTVLVAHVISATPGSRWCEIDLRPGMTVLYAPEVAHTGLNREGLRFEFVAADRRDLVKLAGNLGREFVSPPAGQVALLDPSSSVGAVVTALSTVVDDARHGVPPGIDSSDDLLGALLRVTSTVPSARGVSHRSNRLDSRQIVLTCLDYAEASGRLPTIEELCLVAFVSERRLRYAFADVYGTSPSRFFRMWALNRVHCELLRREPGTVLVQRIARSVGFAHEGRLAQRYQQLFGETPRETLARPAD
jgi:AraC-like DNA-binding protein